MAVAILHHELAAVPGHVAKSSSEFYALTFPRSHTGLKTGHYNARDFDMKATVSRTEVGGYCAECLEKLSS